MSGHQILRYATFSGTKESVLALLHSTPVNSRESEQALETWKSLDNAIGGLVSLASVDCDEFGAACSEFGTHIFPQIVFISGGEILYYSGPTTVKSLFMFINNHITSPVAQIDSTLLDWWILNHHSCPTCVIFFQEDPLKRLPLTLTSLSQALSSTHCVAEMRIVDQQIKERFKFAKLPALVSFQCNSSSSETYQSLSGEISKESLRAFVLNSHNKESQQVLELEGVPLLSKESISSACAEICIVVFVQSSKELNGEEKQRVSNVRAAIKSLRTSKVLKQTIPRLVHMLQTQGLYTALQSLHPSASVDLAVWKSRRSRAAVWHGASSVAGFLDQVLSGSGRFLPLKADTSLLLALQSHQAPGQAAQAPTGWGVLVLEGELSWARPSNLFLEHRPAHAPAALGHPDATDEGQGMLV